MKRSFFILLAVTSLGSSALASGGKSDLPSDSNTRNAETEMLSALDSYAGNTFRLTSEFLYAVGSRMGATQYVPIWQETAARVTYLMYVEQGYWVVGITTTDGTVGELMVTRPEDLYHYLQPINQVQG